MTDMPKSPSETSLDAADPHALFQQWARLGNRAQQLWFDYWSKQMQDGVTLGPDPFGLAKAWGDIALMAEPQKLSRLQADFWADSMRLLQATALKVSGESAEQVVTDRPGDKRFAAQEWQENQLFDFIRQSYLLTADYLQRAVGSVEGVDPKSKSKAEFYTRQFIDAMSPTNFALTNPQVLKATVETGGQNLVQGLENLLSDLEKGRISMTDSEAFSVGENVAATPGQVVFENPLFQLIQYTPTTQKVQEIPIIICPPWINKYYILDLTPRKSFVKWCLDQGLTVFMVSWVNPDSDLRDASFADYVVDGEIKALEVARAITGAPAVHMIGYCVAGTALATGLAWLHAKGRQSEVKTATFFTAQVDFSEPGDLSVFVDAQQLDTIDKMSAEKGYLDANYMANSFNMLRSNDLIWGYVVHNYLMGKDPFPFDLLYWNADSTRLARTCHLYYLQNMYQENNLVKPGCLIVRDTPIDLRLIATPCYIQAGREDHIAPPQSVYKVTRHFSGPLTYVLAGSGHIAGVVNPPVAQKYQYWTNESLPDRYEDFIAGATETPGSWWPHWLAWVQPQSGDWVSARAPGSAEYPPLEEAPGRYVRAK